MLVYGRFAMVHTAAAKSSAASNHLMMTRHPSATIAHRVAARLRLLDDAVLLAASCRQSDNIILLSPLKNSCSECTSAV